MCFNADFGAYILCIGCLCIVVIVVIFICCTQAAVSYGTPIMSEEWIFRCWDFRDDVGVSANDEHLVMMHFVVAVNHSNWNCKVNITSWYVGVLTRVVLLLHFSYELNVKCFQMQYKLGPFSYAFVSFLGFSKEEMRHMEEVTVENGTA